MKKRNIPRPVEQSGRRRFGRSQWDHILDPYKRVHKLHEQPVCPECGAVYHEARRPLISVLMAFGIGLLIGKLIGR